MRFFLVFDTPSVDANSEALFTGNESVIGLDIAVYILAGVSICEKGFAQISHDPRSSAVRFRGAGKKKKGHVFERGLLGL
jgi:hypothetical protein